MEKDGHFKIHMNGFFEQGTVYTQGAGNFIVKTKPKRKWYKMLWQIVSFGFYKAPWEYVVEPYVKTMSYEMPSAVPNIYDYKPWIDQNEGN